MSDVGHGSTAQYRDHGCRCAECRTAWNHYMAEMTAARWRRTAENGGIAPGDRKHGLPATHTNWGCQCWPCLEAKREKGMASYQRTTDRGDA